MLKLELSHLAKDGERIQQLYGKRDELLDGIFEGQYGSDLEIQLERELDVALEQKHHVDQAFFRWKQAHIHARQASVQVQRAIQRWQDIANVPIEESEKRYEMASTTRDFLLEAVGNLANAQRYLPNITFPYCTPEELETLDQAISYIYNDAKSQERHEHALMCYRSTYRRIMALKQWLEHVLNVTISRDLFEITEECKSLANDLRAERTRLIRLKIKEITGSEDLNGNGSNDLRGIVVFAWVCRLKYE